MNYSCIGLFGMDINVGDFVCYPGRGGSDIWVRCGFVVSIKDNIIQVVRGIKYDTYDVVNDIPYQTQYFKRIYTIKSIHLVGKIDFTITQYNNPTHEEYSIYQEILLDIQTNKYTTSGEE